jgi:hypothetical protein
MARRTRHRPFARLFISVCRAANVAVMPARPHPGAALRSDSVEAEDAADDNAVFQHIVIVVAPLPRGAGLPRRA